MDVLITFKIKIEGQTLEHGCIQIPWQNPNQVPDATPLSRTSSILQGPRDNIES